MSAATIDQCPDATALAAPIEAPVDVQDADATTTVLAEPTIEQAQLLLAACPDLRTAQSLFRLNRSWAQVAADDTSYKALAHLTALEARLHYESSISAEPPKGSSWRAECRALFDARGTFISTFGGRSTPQPRAKPFSIAVGCRFRPPGGISGPATRDMVLPLHQRLRLIQQCLGCSLSEARRQLFTSQGQAILADPWARSDAVFSAASVPAPVAAADATDDKENCSNAPLQEGVVAGCDHASATAEPGAAPAAADPAADPVADDDKDDDGASAGGSSTSHRASTGLIALNGSSAIICAPGGVGIRAFDFDHAWGKDAAQEEGA